jgi:hypothetical protein
MVVCSLSSHAFRYGMARSVFEYFTAVGASRQVSFRSDEIQWMESLTLSLLHLCNDGFICVVLDPWCSLAGAVGVCLHHL